MIEDTARVLFILGALFAITGPAIAAVRTAAKYNKAKQMKGTRAELNAFAQRARVEAKGDAWWGVAEFGLVGLGVVFAAVASIILIP
ncbi:hypothetical protein [uncultured Microbacterium sp.]|uniref:hypothetical protein n=1 Tax=uncultured Microbacterium sp. TaxID=191216 RepID=UPI0028E842BD|nr:hypothetical protein [uncultured Microbacterium sp.]